MGYYIIQHNIGARRAKWKLQNGEINWNNTQMERRSERLNRREYFKKFRKPQAPRQIKKMRLLEGGNRTSFIIMRSLITFRHMDIWFVTKQVGKHLRPLKDWGLNRLSWSGWSIWRDRPLTNMEIISEITKKHYFSLVLPVVQMWGSENCRRVPWPGQSNRQKDGWKEPE